MGLIGYEREANDPVVALTIWGIFPPRCCLVPRSLHSTWLRHYYLAGRWLLLLPVMLFLFQDKHHGGFYRLFCCEYNGH